MFTPRMKTAILLLFIAYNAALAQKPRVSSELQLADYSNLRDRIMSKSMHRAASGYALIHFEVDQAGKVIGFDVNSRYYEREGDRVKKHADSVDRAFFSGLIFLPTGYAYKVKCKIYKYAQYYSNGAESDFNFGFGQLAKDETEAFFLDEHDKPKEFIKTQFGLVMAPIYIHGIK